VSAAPSILTKATQGQGIKVDAGPSKNNKKWWQLSIRARPFRKLSRWGGQKRKKSKRDQRSSLPNSKRKKSILLCIEEKKEKKNGGHG